MNQQPTVSPRAGFRYKLRNGLVTQKMQQRLRGGKLSIGYPFITLVKEEDGDIEARTYTHAGCYLSDGDPKSNHPYDIVEELPIEWSDLELNDNFEFANHLKLSIHFNGVPVAYIAYQRKEDTLQYIREHFSPLIKPNPNIERMKLDIKDMEDKLNDMKSALNKMEGNA